MELVIDFDERLCINMDTFDFIYTLRITEERIDTNMDIDVTEKDAMKRKTFSHRSFLRKCIR